MDSKRAIGGFCTFVGGAVVNVIQATEPNWFGNHAWILPASFVVLLIGLLVWICQYGWMQRLLGIQQGTAPASSASPPWKNKEYWRGLYEKEHQEKIQLEAIRDEARREKAQHDSDLWRAQEARRQCEQERQAVLDTANDLRANLAIFTPLQIDALRFRQKLIAFMKELGPEPVCDTSDCLDNPTLNAQRITEWHNKVMPFRGKLRSLYALNFKTEAVEMYHRFVVAGIKDVHFGSLADTTDSVGNLKDLINTLWVVAGRIGESEQ